jgi:hypothetical protein
MGIAPEKAKLWKDFTSLTKDALVRARSMGIAPEQAKTWADLTSSMEAALAGFRSRGNLTATRLRDAAFVFATAAVFSQTADKAKFYERQGALLAEEIQLRFATAPATVTEHKVRKSAEAYLSAARVYETHGDKMRCYKTRGDIYSTMMARVRSSTTELDDCYWNAGEAYLKAAEYAHHDREERARLYEASGNSCRKGANLYDLSPHKLEIIRDCFQAYESAWEYYSDPGDKARVNGILSALRAEMNADSSSSSSSSSASSSPSSLSSLLSAPSLPLPSSSSAAPQPAATGGHD